MTLQRWLEQEFFPVLDRHRLERGKKLYHNGKLEDLENHGQGFFATVKGSMGSSYEIDAYLPIDENGEPDIETMSISCSCPDWAEFCKHGICAMINFCKEQEGNIPTVFQTHEGAEEVKKALSDEMETIMDLAPVPLLEGDGGKLRRMHRTVKMKIRDRTF
ncbi:MAG TPA: hypothetical protein VFT51_09950 [Bacillales bacterium]|nr:hypothetical protein [Bacillales bacterium]